MPHKRESASSLAQRAPLLAKIAAACLVVATFGCASLTPDSVTNPTKPGIITPTLMPTPTTAPATTIPAHTEAPTPTPSEAVWSIDPKGDVASVGIDVEGIGCEIDGENLRATLLIRDVPNELDFNRAGVPGDRLEYGWLVYVDVDNELATGVREDPSINGADYGLGAMYFVRDPGNTVTEPIPSVVQVDVFGLEGMDFSRFEDAELLVDPEAETMILAGRIPGLNAGSRLFFYTYDYNPGGRPESDTGDLTCDALAGGGGASEIPAKNYDDNGIAFIYPQSWEVISPDQLNVYVTDYSYLAVLADSEEGTGAVARFVIVQTDKTCDEYLSQERSYYLERNQGQSAEKAILVHGTPAVQFETTGSTPSGEKVKTINIYFEHEDQVYYLTFSVPVKNYDPVLPAIEMILDSFEIK